MSAYRTPQEQALANRIRKLREEQRKAELDFRFSDSEFIDFQIHDAIETLKAERRNNRW